MEIKRDHYLKKLINRQHNNLIKIVTGVRRCGKTYLLFNLFHGYLMDSGVAQDHIIGIPLDDRSYKELRDPDNMLAFVKSRVSGNGPYYLMIDEIQLLPEFEDVLNSFLHIPNLDVYVSGSNSKLLSSDVITEFRGRGDEVRIHPLCFREFMSVYDGPEEQGWNEYFSYGGMPLVLSMKNYEDKAHYLKSMFKKVYMTDILERHKIRNQDEMETLVKILASAVGSLTNPRKLADTFKSRRQAKVSQLTLKKYCDYLEDAFLITKAERYDIKGKKYISTPSKYYFEDVGLRNARLNFRQQEENHIMENIIFNELCVRGYSVDVGVIEVNEKDKKGKVHRKQLEIDFVANKGDKRYYIQSAFMMNTGEKTGQEQRSLNKIPDAFTRAIIVKDNIIPHRDEHGVLTIGVRQFLLNENSLDVY
ncbi:MAG: ATP-binding protein [Fretibacterium sp.]|nr:ATP-binding protein [Fretibacterium sp.]